MRITQTQLFIINGIIASLANAFSNILTLPESQPQLFFQSVRSCNKVSRPLEQSAAVGAHLPKPGMSGGARGEAKARSVEGSPRRDPRRSGGAAACAGPLGLAAISIPEGPSEWRAGGADSGSAPGLLGATASPGRRHLVSLSPLQ